jgi:hypothetical protein
MGNHRALFFTTHQMAADLHTSAFGMTGFSSSVTYAAKAEKGQ